MTCIDSLCFGYCITYVLASFSASESGMGDYLGRFLHHQTRASLLVGARLLVVFLVLVWDNGVVDVLNHIPTAVLSISTFVAI